MVLPAPLGPITPTASPALISKTDAEQRLEGAVACIDRPELEHCRALA